MIHQAKSYRLATPSANHPFPENFNWYIIRTKPHCERKVVNLLTRKRIKNFCPLHKAESDWYDWKKVVQKPLFPAFVFVYTGEEKHAEILQTTSVLNFIYWLAAPVIITRGEIDTIRIILKEYEKVRLEKTTVKKDYMGKMAETLLLLQKGTFNNEVRIILPSLGYYLIATLRRGAAGLQT